MIGHALRVAVAGQFHHMIVEKWPRILGRSVLRLPYIHLPEGLASLDTHARWRIETGIDGEHGVLGE
jgi:hypothetical protein